MNLKNSCTDEVESYFSTTIFNIENSITVNEKIYTKRYSSCNSFENNFFNIFNMSTHEFTSLEQSEKIKNSLNCCNVFFITINSSQIEKIGLTLFEEIIKKSIYKEAKKLVIPIIIDSEVSSYENSSKYSGISCSHFICENSESAKIIIEGIISFEATDQWYPCSLNFIEEMFDFNKAGRLFLKVYKGDSSNFDAQDSLKELKNSNSVLVNVITHENWMRSHKLGDCEILIQNMNNYFEPDYSYCSGIVSGKKRNLNIEQNEILVIGYGSKIKAKYWDIF